jgi:cellulose synthase (UDP-forming)
MSARSDRWRVAGFALYVALTLAYLLWRVLFSINPAAQVYSWVFWSLELYASACSIAFYATILRRPPRVAQPPLTGASVDVFICTYNEALPLLRQTIRRALAMDYPHRTYLLDDGDRPEARALAEELGCGYLRRDRNEHFKAGNLNNALSQTDGEFVVVLDADHLARRELITRLIGYFADPQVALVQTPQVFYNIDSFQHHFQPSKKRMWHEGAIFHHAMQPGADRWNAAFFVGTGAIVRRSAVERIGGFATGSVTEDAFTCMRLHAAGFRSVYHDEPLAYLVAPESLLQYLVQRLRWGQGSMQILRMENPLWRRGLSWRQRLVYFMALSSFAQAIVHLAYYLAPAVFLLGGPAPLRASGALQLAPILAHVLVDLVTFKLFLGPLARPLLSECYKFLNVYAYLKALSGLFSSKRLKFQVTTKGRDQGASLKLLAPQLVLLLVSLASVGAGTIRLSVAGPALDAQIGIAVATGFSALFVLVGGMALLFAYERIAARTEYTVPENIMAALPGRPEKVRVVRLNEAELHAVVPQAHRPEVGAPITLRLELGPRIGALEVQGLVERVEAARATEASELAVVQVRLQPLPQASLDKLFDRFALKAMPRVIDPLVRAWNPSPPTLALDEEVEDSGYFLPLQPNVL